MKLSKSKLREIIREEIASMIEASAPIRKSKEELSAEEIVSIIWGDHNRPRTSWWEKTKSKASEKFMMGFLGQYYDQYNAPVLSHDLVEKELRKVGFTTTNIRWLDKLVEDSLSRATKEMSREVGKDIPISQDDDPVDFKYRSLWLQDADKYGKQIYEKARKYLLDNVKRYYSKVVE